MARVELGFGEKSIITNGQMISQGRRLLECDDLKSNAMDVGPDQEPMKFVFKSGALFVYLVYRVTMSARVFKLFAGIFSEVHQKGFIEVCSTTDYYIGHMDSRIQVLQVVTFKFAEEPVSSAYR